MPDDPLQTPVQFVRGVGPQRAELLERLGLRTAEDLLWHLPRELLDLTEVRAAGELEPDLWQTVRGRVVDVDARPLSRGRTMVGVLLDCGGQFVRGVWFNQTWPLETLRAGDAVLFSGKPKRRDGRWEFAHPSLQSIEPDDVTAHGGLLPCYGLTEGLRMRQMRRIIAAAVERFGPLVPDPLPQPFRTANALPHLVDAIAQVHRPADRQQFDAARRRLVFDDLLEFQLALAMRRRAWKQLDNAPVLPTTAKIDARIRRLFPFRFTPGQAAAVREIAADLGNGRAMHRLLQADVGAGKTAVAIYTMLVAIAAGWQAVLMAPTELLAAQHWATVETILAGSRVQRRLLTGTLTPTQRRHTLAAIHSGELQLLVGTQAVIQSDVTFAKLGLVVIDEQHKFGVLQRSRLSAGEATPHVLVMTATPIPRSLCLTQFGDLDLTTIHDLPPGRQQVLTRRVSGEPARRKMWEFIRGKLGEGRQAYVVCPRVEADGGPTAGSEEVQRELAAGVLQDCSVGLIHGQMERDRRTEAMQAFRAGTTQVLVSTTVVEVGVDVPNATLMVVLGAERFGLSQLHQLRGRIARGRFPGYAFLVSDATADDALRRLAALEETADGFKIAEVDFELRGPGDVLGIRQHGQLPLKVAHLLRDAEVLHEARRVAFELVGSGAFDTPEFAPLKIRVLERFSRLMELTKSG